jgi:hypothetical protein
MRPAILLALLAYLAVTGSTWMWPVFALALIAVVDSTDPLSLRPRRP